MRPRARALVMALVVGLSAGCGNDGGGPDLSDELAAVRQATEEGDHAAAEEALDDLRRTVGDLQASGDLSESRAGEILAAADGVAQQLAALTTTTTVDTTTTTTVDTTTTTRPGRGNGRGDGDDDDDD